MATATLVPNFTDITLAETETNWTNGGQDSDNKIQGTYCNGDKVSNDRSSITYDSGVNRDFSSGGTDEGKHIFIWLKCLHTGKLELKANGGICVRIENAGGDWGEWYVDGRDTSKGGWKCYVIDPSTQFDAASGWTTSANPAQLDDVDVFGATFETISSITGNTSNCFVDAIRIGYGYTVYGGSNGDELTFDDILAVDEHSDYQYGVLRKDSGVFFAQGQITLGTASQTTYFDDSGVTLAWQENEFIGDAFYQLNIAQANTYAVFGSLTGGVISAPVNIVSYDKEWTLDCDDANIAEMKVYGSSFVGGGTSDLASPNTGDGFYSCTWDGMGEITLNDAVIEDSKILNSTDTYALTTDLTNETTNLENIIFAGNSSYAIYVPVSTGDIAFDFDQLYFSGNVTKDVYYADVSDTLTINVQNGGDVPTADTAGGTVKTVNAKTLTIRNVVVGSRVRVEKKSDGSLIWDEEATDTTISKTDYNYTADVDAWVKARYASYGLSGAIILANDLKATINIHFNDYGGGSEEHKTLDPLITAADATNEATLVTLTSALQDEYSDHDDDAILGTPTYHQATGTEYALATEVNPTTLTGCIPVLNDIKDKYNSHRQDSTSHTNGDSPAEDQEDATDINYKNLKYGATITTIGMGVTLQQIPDTVN